MTTAASTMANDAAVTFDGVTKSFGDVRALDNVSLAIPRGELEQCGLAAAGWPEQRHEFAAADLKRHVVERLHVAEILADAVKGDCRILARGSGRVRHVAPSVALFDIEHLAETEKAVGKGDKDGGGHDIHHRQRRHRGIGELADIVVHRDRQGLRPL